MDEPGKKKKPKYLCMCVSACVCLFHTLQRVVSLPLSQGASMGASSPFMADIPSMGLCAIYKPPVCHSGPETRADSLVEVVKVVEVMVEEVLVLVTFTIVLNMCF